MTGVRLKSYGISTNKMFFQNKKKQKKKEILQSIKRIAANLFSCDHNIFGSIKLKFTQETHKSRLVLNCSKLVMNLYAEHGCIFILLFRTINRHIHSRLLTCALTYKELAGFILFQKAKIK